MYRAGASAASRISNLPDGAQIPYHGAMSTPNELSGPSPPADPLVLLARWIAEAGTLRVQPNPNAMVLATCAADGRPSARVVLCKDVTSEPGYLTFYTNYQSRKGRELEVHGRAAVVFHWDALHRQARIEGPVVKAPSHDSDAYFAARPWQSRIGAWASAQSEVTDSRAALERSLAAAAARFGAPLPGSPGADGPFAGTIPRPPHWGGYRLWAEAVELWVEGAARLHDRLLWTRHVSPSGETFHVEPWTVRRLQP